MGPVDNDSLTNNDVASIKLVASRGLMVSANKI